MFLAHIYLFIRQHTHTSFVIVEIRIVFIQFADTHTLLFVACKNGKIKKKTSEKSKKKTVRNKIHPAKLVARITSERMSGLDTSSASE